MDEDGEPVRDGTPAGFGRRLVARIPPDPGMPEDFSQLIERLDLLTGCRC